MGAFDNRFVSLAIEGGGYGVIGSGAAKYGDVDDESFAGRYDLIDRSDMNYSAISKSVVGKEYADGSLNMALQGDDFLGTLLKGIYPTDTKAGSGPYTHTFTEAGTFPSYQIVVQRDTHVHTFGGMCLNRLGISASMNEYVMVSADFVGQAEDDVQTISAASLTPSFSALDGMHFVNADITFSADAQGASPSVKSISIDFNLNRDTDNAHGLGDSGYTIAPPAQRREVSGTIEFIKPMYNSEQVYSEPTYDGLIYDNTNNVTDGTNAAPAIKCVFSDGTNSLDLRIFKVVYEAPETNVSGRDTQTMTVAFRGLYDTGEEAVTKTVLTNQQATAY